MKKKPDNLDQLLDECDTLMLDMDGTLLDLGFDNYVWMELVPEKFAQKNGMSEAAARDQLFAKMRSLQGQLDWYCLDHWSEVLDLDIAALHREVNHRIGFLPGAHEFLESLAGHELRVLMVTNSHRETLSIKSEVTGVAGFFDEIYTSHDLGHAKEDQPFWAELREREQFDAGRTLFVDDNLQVLASARQFGLDKLLAIARPVSHEPARTVEGFVAIQGVSDLMQS